ncbi:exodeoxyribonuclease V subunit beta [Pseudoxanthomonas sp. PXM02]|uniref:UvrD-helicase domain-containing protein n=1 Tax=Pseudoxanthomonas sp. PXM02 TaxID=2769294 RepID=UPI00177BCBA3|nr:exodeoxyribonuclease V subunit beta [Pseudoxanthomonas sp. PXM02]MBD9480583.1 UvrD-helicase domain-containing protein [Pseudoxanthomonas sp. PXM02]
MTAFDLAREPYLTRALDGVQLIEASAGTGKTYTLATLFTRLIVEQRRRMGEVLAVTYTEAATQELRKRIRERLALAATLVGTPSREDESHEAALTRFVLDRHLAQGDETPAQLARRLRIAAEETDLAAIFTIHGFCARVLREHALDAGQGFDAGELLGNARALHADLAADLWRSHAADPATVAALTGLWSGPEALADDLPALCGPLPLLPPAPTSIAGDEVASLLALARTRLAEGVSTEGEAYFTALLAAVDGGILNKTSYKPDWLSQLHRQVVAWARHPAFDAPMQDKLFKLTLDALTKGTKKDYAGKTPVSSLQPLIADYAVALERYTQWRRDQSILLLHRLRDDARRRLDALKRTRRVQTYDDLIERVATALDGPRRQTLVAALRAQYRVALVDEFQDTDERQWRIFARVFGDSDEVRALGETPALFLIGDPKQAIYGFRGGDVATYLLARGAADEAPRLAHNFRSRPSVLQAVRALYDGAASAGQDAFAHPDIRFEPVEPGGKRHDDDYLEGETAAPALTLRLLRNADGGAFDAETSREAATAACVADIHRVLAEARDGGARIDGRPVRPGDIAVLVRNHKDATRMQQALARAGVPAVAAGKQSLFASPEAGELCTLLLALLHPADSGRLRAALATVLLGEDAPALAALEDDGEAQRQHQARLLHWRERWQRGGPFALVSELCAAQAERLLGLLDGERRLTNYLQLGEHLQEAAAHTLGLHGLLDWLQARIADADPDDEAQLLRLESDALRVQIVTLHKSKGLEYPLVYLPFAGLGTSRPDSGRYRVVHDGTQRVLLWKLDKDDPAWRAAGEAKKRDDQAEDARLLYVGLTRAEHALWIAAGDVADLPKSRLAPLLADIATLAAQPGVRIVEGPPEPPPARLPPERETAVAPARVATRRITPDWWVYSFTQLAHADGGADPLAAATQADPGGEDEAPSSDTEALPEAVAAPLAVVDPRFAGSRFGVVMHAALEHADFAAWRDWQPGDAAPAGQDVVIAEALREGGYAEAEVADGLAVLVPLVGHTLGTALPEGVRLADLPVDQRRAEIEFHFAMQPTAVATLLALLHRHGLLRQRTAFGVRPRLEGLMTGLIDLTYVHDGRWYVLDYKSNQLPAYDAAAMQQAMAHSEYDLQALIYTLALHRWLRFRLGEAYDYARDFGGIRYLFCRGLDLARQASPGVHAQRFAPELVHALDALFAGDAPGAAA